MKASSLRTVAGSNTLLRNHLRSVQSEFDQCKAKASAQMHCDHALPIRVLLNELNNHLKMVIRIQQVQFTQINKYKQSIRTARKVKRGEHAPTDMITDVMVPMALRFIQDLKCTLTELTQPIITRIHAKLHDLHDRMSLFQMFADMTKPDTCQCNRFGTSCYACYQGAHDQCPYHCTE